MGKGLSRLQRGLLLMALENMRRPAGERERALVERLDNQTSHDASFSYAQYEYPVPDLMTHEALQGCTRASARVSISRAFARLEERGLVRRKHCYIVEGRLLWSGIYLTAKGREAARKLEEDNG